MDNIGAIGDISANALSASALPALSAKINPNANIDKSAQDFEAMFATQMLQPMFEGIAVDPVFGGGHGEEVMRSFMLQEYGKIIAKTGKLGIGNQVKSEMLKAQEAARARGNAAGNKSMAEAASAYAATSGHNDNMGGANVTH